MPVVICILTNFIFVLSSNHRLMNFVEETVEMGLVSLNRNNIPNFVIFHPIDKYCQMCVCVCVPQFLRVFNDFKNLDYCPTNIFFKYSDVQICKYFLYKVLVSFISTSINVFRMIIRSKYLNFY